MDSQNFRRINIIGHKSPDTDSICSALALSWLKNKGSFNGIYEARRAGAINRESRYVLDYFGVEAPRLCTDLSPQIKNIDIRMRPGVSKDLSLYEARRLMKTEDIDTLCITDKNSFLLGLVTVGDISNVNMELLDESLLSKAGTSYKNILDTLSARLIFGDRRKKITKGRVCVTSTPEFMKEFVKPGDIVIGVNQLETQLCAIDLGADALILTYNAHVLPEVLKKAMEKGCDIFVTPHDTYNATRLISTSIPVGYIMRTEDLKTFTLNTPVEDAVKIMSEVRHRYFPILDQDGKYVGVVSRRNFLNLHKKQVILVDHNEKAQAVDGLMESEILEVIDHHRIGDLETRGPVYFRNEAVGCTATIIFHMFKEEGMKPDKKVAGLLLAAIISDTLLFRSPTSTSLDEREAKELAKIAGVDIESFAESMFEAGASLEGLSAEDVFKSDFKIFSYGDVRFGVGQSIYMTENSRKDAEKLVEPYLRKVSETGKLPMFFYMFTDMKNESTDLMFGGKGAGDAVKNAFNVETTNDIAKLKGVVSRKKQLVPPLMAAIQTQER